LPVCMCACTEQPRCTRTQARTFAPASILLATTTAAALLTSTAASTPILIIFRLPLFPAAAAAAALIHALRAAACLRCGRRCSSSRMGAASGLRSCLHAGKQASSHASSRKRVRPCGKTPMRQNATRAPLPLSLPCCYTALMHLQQLLPAAAAAAAAPGWGHTRQPQHDPPGGAACASGAPALRCPPLQTAADAAAASAHPMPSHALRWRAAAPAHRSVYACFVCACA